MAKKAKAHKIRARLCSFVLFLNVPCSSLRGDKNAPRQTGEGRRVGFCKRIRRRQFPLNRMAIFTKRGREGNRGMRGILRRKKTPTLLREQANVRVERESRERGKLISLSPPCSRRHVGGGGVGLIKIVSEPFVKELYLLDNISPSFM